MKRFPPNLKLSDKLPNGEVITKYQYPLVVTTAQREIGKVYAAIFVYLIVGKYKNGNFKAVKHPQIKGSIAQ